MSPCGILQSRKPLHASINACAGASRLPRAYGGKLTGAPLATSLRLPQAGVYYLCLAKKPASAGYNWMPIDADFVLMAYTSILVQNMLSPPSPSPPLYPLPSQPPSSPTTLFVPSLPLLPLPPLMPKYPSHPKSTAAATATVLPQAPFSPPNSALPLAPLLPFSPKPLLPLDLGAATTLRPEEIIPSTQVSEIGEVKSFIRNRTFFLLFTIVCSVICCLRLPRLLVVAKRWLAEGSNLLSRPNKKWQFL